jgi:hypothetical protein
MDSIEIVRKKIIRRLLREGMMSVTETRDYSVAVAVDRLQDEGLIICSNRFLYLTNKVKALLKYG